MLSADGIIEGEIKYRPQERGKTQDALKNLWREKKMSVKAKKIMCWKVSERKRLEVFEKPVWLKTWITSKVGIGKRNQSRPMSDEVGSNGIFGGSG